MYDRCTIIGGGASCRENQWDKPVKDMKLWSYLKDEFTIGLNRSFFWFESTINMFFDYQVYINDYDKIKDLDIIIGRDFPQLHLQLKHKIEKPLLSNTYLFKISKKYEGQGSWKNGLYAGSSGGQVGPMAISFASLLRFKEIYLLGFDYGHTNNKTHWFQDEIDLNERIIDSNLKWSGVGFKETKTGQRIYKCSYYDAMPHLELYEGFKNCKPKIYNVNLDSKIDLFEKISYDDFYNMLENDKKPLLQSQVRDKVNKILLENL